MRAWKGRKRIAKKFNPDYFTKEWYRRTADYLLNAKPGDVIAACTGFNHYIAELDFRWWDTSNYPVYWRGRGRGSPRARTRIIEEIQVTDTEGRWHWFPAGGCVQLPETREEVIAYRLSWNHPEAQEIAEKWKFDQRPLRAILEGRDTEFLDSNGVIIPGSLDAMYGPWDRILQ